MATTNRDLPAELNITSAPSPETTSDDLPALLRVTSAAAGGDTSIDLPAWAYIVPSGAETTYADIPASGEVTNLYFEIAGIVMARLTTPFQVFGRVKEVLTYTFTIRGTLPEYQSTFSVVGSVGTTVQVQTLGVAGTVGTSSSPFTVTGTIPELISYFSLAGEVAPWESTFVVTGTLPTQPTPPEPGSESNIDVEYGVADPALDIGTSWGVAPLSLSDIEVAWEILASTSGISAAWEVPLLVASIETSYDVAPGISSIGASWRIYDSEQTDTFQIGGTVRLPAKDSTFQIGGTVDVIAVFRIFFDAECTNAVSLLGSGYTNPIWKQVVYKWYEGNPTRDLQLYVKNIGYEAATNVSIGTVDGGGVVQTWTKLAKTQGGLESASYEISFDSMPIGNVEAFWIRSAVPGGTSAPQLFRNSFLKIEFERGV